MQIQSTVRLAAMQKDGDASNSDMGDDQGENQNFPPRPSQIAIGQPTQKWIKTRCSEDWICNQKEVPKEV